MTSPLPNCRTELADWLAPVAPVTPRLPNLVPEPPGILICEGNPWLSRDPDAAMVGVTVTWDVVAYVADGPAEDVSARLDTLAAGVWNRLTDSGAYSCREMSEPFAIALPSNRKGAAVRITCTTNLERA